MTGADVRYVIEDGEELARQHPLTFKVPPLVYRDHLAPGDLAKLVIAPTEKGGVTERMWVAVTDVRQLGRSTFYRGRLANAPIATDKGLALAEELAFEPRHVIDIMRGAGGDS
jgi:hypothetical protein